MAEGLLENVVVWFENAGRDILSALSGGVAVKGYYDLPQPPTPEPPAVRALGEIDEHVRPLFVALENSLLTVLAPLGWRAVRQETYRSPERQAWLYGIGRDYQAPGRHGIVTNAKTASGPHVQRRAVDYAYVPINATTTPDPETLMTALKGIANSYSYDLTWGATFSTVAGDTGHWEAKHVAG